MLKVPLLTLAARNFPGRPSLQFVRLDDINVRCQFGPFGAGAVLGAAHQLVRALHQHRVHSVGHLRKACYRLGRSSAALRRHSDRRVKWEIRTDRPIAGQRRHRDGLEQ